ncbi:MAG: hypothetical protein QM652_05540 [Legionella sp.]|uniref:hypothetical protein n=1 Tax=Legionella sp. TaxID=459 RepID=UPI0039E36D07
MDKTLNLIYSCPTRLNFFGKIKQIGGIVVKFKSEGVINDFGTADENEVGRRGSYAVFPELQTMFESGEKITLAALREGLRSRGVVDQFMQNKAMTMLLQCKAGVHYAMGNVLNGLLLDNGHDFLMCPDYDVKFEVQSPNHVKLVFNGTWQNIKKDPREDSLQARVEIDITPERIAIYNFNVTQISKSPEAEQAFRFLQNNQTSIWQKIVTFFKTYFNANSDLEIENVALDNKPWHENTKKIDEPLVDVEESSSEEDDLDNGDSGFIPQ